MKTILLAFLLQAQPPASAGQTGWIEIYSAQDGTRAYYDPASIERGEGTVRVRMRALPGGEIGKSVREFVAIEEFNCARRTTTTRALTAELQDGQRMEVPPDGRVDAVHANTPAAALFDRVCTAAPTV
jgi:hypothetical protein